MMHVLGLRVYSTKVNDMSKKSESVRRFRVPYGERQRCRVSFDPAESRTEQSHKADCDINNIIAKFDRTGLLVSRNDKTPDYGFATSQSFQDAMFVVAQAQTMFNEMPESVRERFEHDPAKLLDFVNDPNNAKDLVDMGLATARPEPAPIFDSEQLRTALTQALSDVTPPDPAGKGVTKEESPKG
jgi:phage internal scaffolding protein